MPRRNRILALAVLWALCVAPGRGQGLPDHAGKVNDLAGLLEPAQRQALEAQLADLERATAAEVAVVTIPTLGGRALEDYATDLFKAWGIGKADRDNGVLILVAVQERAIRIEVGYGLEGILPDGLAGAVIRETFLPRFRGGDYRAGLLDGTARVIDIIRQHETLTPEQRAALDAAAADASKSWGLAALLGILVAAGALAFGAAAAARVAVQMLFGLCVTGGVLYMSTFETPRAATWLLSLVALAVASAGYKLGRRPKWRRLLRGPGSGSGWITEGTGGSSGSSGDSGSSSSGDFGGGSSGGGGASGHW